MLARFLSNKLLEYCRHPHANFVAQAALAAAHGQQQVGQAGGWAGQGGGGHKHVWCAAVWMGVMLDCVMWVGGWVRGGGLSSPSPDLSVADV